jgi:hypothetical protein
MRETDVKIEEGPVERAKGKGQEKGQEDGQKKEGRKKEELPEAANAEKAKEEELGKEGGARTQECFCNRIG